MESSAILVYLQEKHDRDNVFGFSDASEKSQILQWLFFWHSSTPLMAFTRQFSIKEPVPGK